MKSKDFLEIFRSGKISLNSISFLKSMILEYINNVENEKTVKHIYNIEESKEIEFNAHDLLQILNCYIIDEIKEWDLEYLLIIIELNFEIYNEKVENILFNLTDPYLGYPINKENVNISIEYLNHDLSELKLKDYDEMKGRSKYNTIFRD